MDFKLIGLNKYESRAYETVTKLGKATAAKIASESNVPYSRIYDILEALTNKGLVKVIPEKTKQFIASDPENLSKLLQQKKQEIEQMEKELRELKQQYEFHEKDPIIVSKGKINFAKMLKEMPEAKKFSYKIKYTSDVSPEWIRENKAYIKKGIKTKTLARYDEETKKNVQKWMELDPNFRKFENNGIAININEAAVLISMIPPKNPSAIIVINNKNFADIMKRLFEAAYDEAEQIHKE